MRWQNSLLKRRMWCRMFQWHHCLWYTEWCEVFCSALGRQTTNGPTKPRLLWEYSRTKRNNYGSCLKIRWNHADRLKVRIKDLWEALLNEQFAATFSNSLEVSAYRKLETKYSKWSWSLHCAMMETENKVYNKIKNEEIHKLEEINLQSELKKTCGTEVEKSMSEFFEKDKDKDILNQWKPSFEIKIKELQENIVRETKSKLTRFFFSETWRKQLMFRGHIMKTLSMKRAKNLPWNSKTKQMMKKHWRKSLICFGKRVWRRSETILQSKTLT